MTIVNFKIKIISSVFLLITLSNQLNAGIIKKTIVGGAVVGAVALASQKMHPLSVGKLYWKDVKTLAISQEPFFRNMHACYVTAFKEGSLHFPCTSEGKPIWGKNLSAEYIEYPRFWISKKNMDKNLYFFLIQERVRLLETNDGGFYVVMLNELEALFWENYIKTASSNTAGELNNSSIEKKIEEIIKSKDKTINKEEKQKIVASFKKIGTNEKTNAPDKEAGLKQPSNATAKTNSDTKEDDSLSTQLMPFNMQQYYRVVKSKKKAPEKPQMPMVLQTQNPIKDTNNTTGTKNTLDKNATKDCNVTTDSNKTLCTDKDLNSTIDSNASKDLNVKLNAKNTTEKQGKI